MVYLNYYAEPCWWLSTEYFRILGDPLVSLMYKFATQQNFVFGYMPAFDGTLWIVKSLITKGICDVQRSLKPAGNLTHWPLGNLNEILDM